MEQDIIVISDSEDTIIVADPEVEASLLSSEDEAPPPKRRQKGRACKPSTQAALAKTWLKSDSEE